MPGTWGDAANLCVSMGLIAGESTVAAIAQLPMSFVWAGRQVGVTAVLAAGRLGRW